jgi:hypothetical protein
MAAWSLSTGLHDSFFSCGRADPGEDKNEQGKAESREAQYVYRIDPCHFALGIRILSRNCFLKENPLGKKGINNIEITFQSFDI